MVRTRLISGQSTSAPRSRLSHTTRLAPASAWAKIALRRSSRQLDHEQAAASVPLAATFTIVNTVVFPVPAMGAVTNHAGRDGKNWRTIIVMSNATSAAFPSAFVGTSPSHSPVRNL